MSTLRLKRVSASNFRGIDAATLSLLDQNDRPQSLFLYGDNGVGKTSILDAAVYALSGKPPTLTNTTSSIALPICRISAHGGFWAEVELSDGRVIRSSPGSVAQVVGDSARLDDFRIATPIIKRDLVQAFARASDENRGGLLRYLINARYLPTDAKSDDEVDVAKRRSELSKLIDTKCTELGRKLRLPRDERLPESLHELQIFVTAKRISKKQIHLGRGRRYGDEATTLVSLGEELLDLFRERESLNNRLSRSAKVRQRARSVEVLVRASEILNSSFAAIAPPEIVGILTDLQVAETDGGAGASLTGVAADGSRYPVCHLLSEAWADVVSLLSLLAVHRDAVERGQPRFLILDDVFHSIDNVVRDRVARHIFAELANWQLIVAFHDRLWLERWKAIATELRFPFTVRRVWRSSDGTVVFAGDYSTAADELRDSLTAGDFQHVPNRATRVIEVTFEELSMRLNAKVVRDSKDTYTLAQLMPGVEEMIPSSSLAGQALARLGKTAYLRNLVGAHSTSWAESFSDQESRDFGETVLQFFDAVFCEDCKSFIRRVRGATRCSCGLISVL